jgi:type IV secretion system protein VirD4
MSTVVINEQETLKNRIIHYVIGFIPTLYLAMLWGASWTKGCSLSEWLDNFYIFVFEQHHIIVGVTPTTPKAIMVFEMVWTLFYLVSITKIKHPYAGREYGDAKWGNPDSFTRNFGNHDKDYIVKVNFGKDVKEPIVPVYVNTHNYWLAEGVYLNIDNKLTSNLNIEVVGPPGTGKSFRLVRPILSQLAGSFLVTDPKGELSQQTGQYMEDNGYGVFIIDCESEMGMTNSHHFNPFWYLETESDILSLCEILFKATKNKDAGSGDQFFEDMAMVLLTDIFYLMHYTYAKQNQDWKHFVELLNCDTVRANPQTGAIDISDPNCLMQRFIRANNDWMKGHNGEELKGFRDVEKIYTNAQETASSIISSLDAHCKYMKLDCVVDLLSSDDLDFINTFGYGKKSKKSETGKYILYMVTSESVRHFDWIPSMIYSLFIDKLYALTKNDASLHQTLPNHLTFLMDEFYNVTLPDSFVGLTSTMRSRGISVVVIIQNLLQLKDKFPNNDQDKNLRSNMNTTIILGGPDQESCKTLAEDFGKHTIHKQTTGLTRGGQGSSSENEDVMEHYLMPAQDIYRMAKDGPCAVNVKGTDPLWVSKVRFENSPLCPLLTRKIPYTVKKEEYDGLTRYDTSKSPCEQLPEILFGKAAESYLKQCEENGIPVVKVSETDVDAISLIKSHGKEMPGKDSTTNEFWRKVYESTQEIINNDRRKELDIDSYDGEQLMTMQRLRNKGFNPEQINALEGLVREGFGFDEITMYFNSGMTVNEIKPVADKIIAYRRK